MTRPCLAALPTQTNSPKTTSEDSKPIEIFSSRRSERSQLAMAASTAGDDFDDDVRTHATASQPLQPRLILSLGIFHRRHRQHPISR